MYYMGLVDEKWSCTKRPYKYILFLIDEIFNLASSVFQALNALTAVLITPMPFDRFKNDLEM